MRPAAQVIGQLRERADLPGTWPSSSLDWILLFGEGTVHATDDDAVV